MNKLRKIKIIDDIDEAVKANEYGNREEAIAHALIAIARMMAHDRNVFDENDDDETK